MRWNSEERARRKLMGLGATETVHPFDNKTFDLSKETAVADMLRWAESLEKA